MRARQDPARLARGLNLSLEGAEDFVQGASHWTLDDVVRVADALGMEIDFRVHYEGDE